MKLNNKGFTMVELLAAVAILGILSGVAVMGVTRYREKVRQEAYETMEKSAYTAAQNYILDKGTVVSSSATSPTIINIIDLVDEGYLQNLEDPKAKGKYCHADSNVKVTKTERTGTAIDEYTYLVTIKCNGNYTSTRTDDHGNTLEGVIFNS